MNRQPRPRPEAYPVLDWMVRTAAPCWLRAAGEDAFADRLVLQSPIRRREGVATAVELAREAVWVLNDSFVVVWDRVASRTCDCDQPGGWILLSAQAAAEARLGRSTTGAGLATVAVGRQSSAAWWQTVTQVVVDAAELVAWHAIDEQTLVPASQGQQQRAILDAVVGDALVPVERQIRAAWRRLQNRLDGSQPQVWVVPTARGAHR